MTTRPGKHLFSFSDFNPSRRLSTTMGEPAIAGHIRWLKRRAQQLLPTDAGPEFHSVCHEWWIEAFHDECVMQREAKWSPHARFDLKKKKVEDFPDFPSDTESVILGAWLTHVLESEEPNPQRKLRSRQRGGSRYRTHVRLHEMLAALALSELHRATVLLVEGPEENCTKVAEVLMAASELLNRSEMHSWAGSRKSASEPVRRRVAIGARLAAKVPLKPNQARVTRIASSLEFEFQGECRRIHRVTRNGRLTRGFSMLLDLLLTPDENLGLLTLDKSYRHKQHAVSDAYSGIHDPELAAEFENLHVGSAVEVELETQQEKRVMRLLEEADKAEKSGDRPRAASLKAEAAEAFENPLVARTAHDGQDSSGVETGKRGTGGRYRDYIKRDGIQNCGKRLEKAIGRLEERFPALGAHLRAGIPHTCSEKIVYTPHPRISWIIEEVE